MSGEELRHFCRSLKSRRSFISRRLKFTARRHKLNKCFSLLQDERRGRGRAVAAAGARDAAAAAASEEGRGRGHGGEGERQVRARRGGAGPGATKWLGCEPRLIVVSLDLHQARFGELKDFTSGLLGKLGLPDPRLLEANP